MARSLLTLFLSIVASLVMSQSSSERAAVRLNATVQASPASITLSWTALSSTSSITVYRKLKSATSWGSSIANPSASATTWTDNSVALGTYYEYKVVRSSGGKTGTGYVATGVQVAPTDYRGKLVLLVDNTLAPSLVTELGQLTQDLRADGWAVLRNDVARNASVSSVRGIVQGHYNSDPTNVKAVYIVGHVPVPYSGNTMPDGHAEFFGARPTDGYYAEMNGSWTDNSVNNTSSSRQENWNVPGDGKFDQSEFPGAIELQVGRVDMYDMPAFSASEVQLMKNYLNKAHSFKLKGWAPTARGLQFDNLQWVADPLAAGGWRNLAPLVGNGNITELAPYGASFGSMVNNQSYLWTNCSSGGLLDFQNNLWLFIGQDNAAITSELATTISVGGVFNMGLGSYYDDFDNKNNYLRALIARGDALTNCWSGIPTWYFHHMGMGDNIGYSTMVSMNNTSVYAPLHDGWQSSIGHTHINLMGDPSLRMKMVAPPTALVISNSGGHPAFSWTASTESVLGYHVYQIETSGSVTRLTTTPVTTTNYSDPAIPYQSGREYMVRAVKLETNYSGSYYNLSLGAMATAPGGAQPDCLGVSGGTATPGTSCNDGNANTINDVWSNSCNCTGTPVVFDCLGVANGAATPGTSCNDGNSNTINDCWSNNCNCTGTPVVFDCLGVANGAATPGTSCNDGNANTINDVWSNNCNCTGTPVVFDCLGVANGAATPGTSCNDGNANTINDVWSNNCNCTGIPVVYDCLSVPNGPAVPGTGCNDGDPNTTNDVWSNNCNCAGIPVVYDCLSVPNGPAMPGTSCNDGDPNTTNDTWSNNCNCAGTPVTQDCLGVPNGTALPGTSCNDGNANTINDVWSNGCACAGTPVVFDCLGVANGTAIPGVSCDDGDTQTTNDVWSNNCNCVGIPVVFDCAGVANGPALPGTPCNDENSATGNDQWNANCQCVGQLIDCTGTAGGPALIGTPCNDNNANTINDMWGSNCNCAGTPVPQDCLGVPNGAALPGTPCDDGDVNTANDVWNSNCNCVGIPVVFDCAGVANGPALPGTPCNDENSATGNDQWNASCQC
ncbi:MAG: hypothetical protein KA186_06330, partial [Flavobacteriales bacterium]|nr:hypothetical protein [Flavobacteriales bacterium]